MKEAATFANPVIGRSELEPMPARPVTEQLAILDQCPNENWTKELADARGILNRQLTSTIQRESERLFRDMKKTKNISKVLAANK